jgi:hypothetical protein
MIFFGEAPHVDNLYVRASTRPSSAQIKNLTWHPTGVTPSGEHRLEKIAHERGADGRGREEPSALREPCPSVIFRGSASRELAFVLGLTTAIRHRLNALAEEIKEAFERDGIEFPYPHREIVTRGALR